MTDELDAPSELRATRLVVARELREAFRRKSVWVTALAFLLVSSAAMILPEMLGDDGDSTRTVVLVGDPSPSFTSVAPEVAEILEVDLTLETASDGEAATATVEDGGADAALRFDVSPSVIVVPHDDDQLVLALLRQALQVAGTIDALAGTGLPEAEIAAVVAPVPPEVEVLDTERSGRRGVALISALVVYLLLLMLSIQVANGVAIEKASRVSEVLLAIVPARALLFGKAIGVGLIGLFTLAAGATPIVVRLALGGRIALVTVVVAVRVASTIYRRAIVRTGRRLSVREVLRSPA